MSNARRVGRRGRGTQEPAAGSAAREIFAIRRTRSGSGDVANSGPLRDASTHMPATTAGERTSPRLGRTHRRPLSNPRHASRRPGIATRGVLGFACTSPVVAKPASLPLAADLRNSTTQQTPSGPSRTSTTEDWVGRRADRDLERAWLFLLRRFPARDSRRSPPLRRVRGRMWPIPSRR